MVSDLVCTLAKYTVCCVCPWPRCGANKLLTDLVGEFTGCPYNYTICLSVSLLVYVSFKKYGGSISLKILPIITFLGHEPTVGRLVVSLHMSTWRHSVTA